MLPNVSNLVYEITKLISEAKEELNANEPIETV